MSAEYEDFVHYVDCIDSLNRAWSIFQDLRKVEHPSAAFRFALIEYAKPYTRSEGFHGRRKLPSPNVPDLLALHQEILDLRNQVLAHSDLTVKQAQLQLHSFNGKPYYIILSNISPSLPSSEALIALIERTLEQMYVERDERLQSLRVQA